MQVHEGACSSLNLHEFPWKCIQFNELACSSTSLYTVPFFVWAAHKNFKVLVFNLKSLPDVTWVENDVDEWINISWYVSIKSSRSCLVAFIDVFNELREDISVELHELTELFSISDSSVSIVVIWDILPQTELNEVTKSKNSEHVILLLLSLVTLSILSVTVSIEDVIVWSFEILSLIVAWDISEVGLIVFVEVYCSGEFVVEAEEDEVGYLVEINVVTVAKVIVVEAKGEIDTVNVWDGDAVIVFEGIDNNVIVEVGKLDLDVKSGDVVIDGELDPVDMLPAVDSRVVGRNIVTGFSGVFGGNSVEELGL